MDFAEVRQIILQLSNVLDKIFGFDIEILEFCDGAGEVDFRDIGNQTPNNRILNAAGYVIDAIFKIFGDVLNFAGSLVDQIVELFGCVLRDISNNTETAVNHGGNQAHVCSSKEVDVEDDDILDTHKDEIKQIHHGFY